MLLEIGSFPTTGQKLQGNGNNRTVFGFVMQKWHVRQISWFLSRKERLKELVEHGPQILFPPPSPLYLPTIGSSKKKTSGIPSQNGWVFVHLINPHQTPSIPRYRYLCLVRIHQDMRNLHLPCQRSNLPLES